VLSLLRDKVTLEGVTIGSVVTFITSIFMIVFHHQLPVDVIALLPAVVAFIAHYLGVTFATTRAAMKELDEDSKQQ
jgi:hypothetical protein